jgi:hypothetical protein
VPALSFVPCEASCWIFPCAFVVASLVISIISAWSLLISMSFLACMWTFSLDRTAKLPSRFCIRSAPGLSLPLNSDPSTTGRRASPCSKPTITSSSGCGSISPPRALPAEKLATRAHALSSESLSEGNLTRTRPACSGSLLLVTMPTTRFLLQSSFSGGWKRSSMPRSERPEIVKLVV